MLNLLKFLGLITYSIIIFFVPDFRALGILFLLTILLFFIVRVPFKNVIVYTLGALPFIILASLVNLFLGDPAGAALVAARFLLACYAVICFKQKFSSMQLANGIETLCYPLKLIKVDPKDIGLMVCIAITFIPILLRDFNQIKCALQAKGMPVTPRNVKYILKPFFYGIFKRTDEISNALMSKAYI